MYGATKEKQSKWFWKTKTAEGIRLHHSNHYYEVITFKQYSTCEEQLWVIKQINQEIDPHKYGQVIFLTKVWRSYAKSINQSIKQKWSFQSVVIEWLDCVLKEGESGEGTEL